MSDTQTPCPRCGYTDGVSTPPMSNHMNEYVDEKTGKPYGVLNSNEDKLVIKGQNLVKKEKFVAPKVAEPSAPKK